MFRWHVDLQTWFDDRCFSASPHLCRSPCVISKEGNVDGSMARDDFIFAFSIVGSLFLFVALCAGHIRRDIRDIRKKLDELNVAPLQNGERTIYML